MYHVHINIVIFQSLLMVFNSDMHDMCSCKQNHVLFIVCNHGNWNVYSWFYSYGTHPTNDLLSCIHLRLVCTVQELNQGCRKWGGGGGGGSLGASAPQDFGGVWDLCIFIYTNQMCTDGLH